MRFDRRDYLSVVGSATSILVAGCTGDSEPDSDTADPDTEDSEDAGETNTQNDENSSTSTEDEPESERIPVYVSDVLTGDTYEVEYEDGTTETVRLAGIDAPAEEKDEVDYEAFGYESNQTARLADFGYKARRLGQAEIWREDVEVEIDPTTPETDENGNRLVFIHHEYGGGRGQDSVWNMSQKLIGLGLARTVDVESKYRDELANAESSAIERGEGMWEYSNG
ncbi:thermonuclease family protein [Natrinema salaciae]|uniref:Endonuclease YncB, thermonuclease family n=1 Tax=Natrinema salaciae TaxID=1186196 RepID=A0A1H8ZQC7_9EURY|nr:thermonuclease family protein [Natrinema salaciae]SEP66481.1 Endonuclease YncB, thermonuclease family [Natrinema salaciae]